MIVFVVALIVRLAAIFGLGLYREPINFMEVEKIARSLAENGAFADPYKIPTGPTAHAAPAYPFLVAVVFKVAGYGIAARTALLLVAAVAASVQYALLPRLATGCGIPANVGAVAGLMGAACPVRLFTELAGWEAPITGMAWVISLIATLGWMAAPSGRASLACGAAWGTTLLVSPPLIAPLGLILAGLTWRYWRGAAGPGWRQIAVVVATVAAFLTPWTVRNYQTFGHFFYLRDNLGLELATSHFPGVSLLADDGHSGETPVHRMHPYTSEAAARQVLEMGEIQFNRHMMAQAMGHIREDPSDFAWRTLGRVWYFWFLPSRFPIYKDLYIFPVTVLGLLGAWLMWRRRPGPGLCFVAGVLGYPAAYYLLKIVNRYRYPIEWMLLFLCCYTLWSYFATTGDRPTCATATSSLGPAEPGVGA
jgi:hypothetical protein